MLSVTGKLQAFGDEPRGSAFGDRHSNERTTESLQEAVFKSRQDVYTHPCLHAGQTLLGGASRAQDTVLPCIRLDSWYPLGIDKEEEQGTARGRAVHFGEK